MTTFVHISVHFCLILFALLNDAGATLASAQSSSCDPGVPRLLIVAREKYDFRDTAFTSTD